MTAALTFAADALDVYARAGTAFVLLLLVGVCVLILVAGLTDRVRHANRVIDQAPVRRHPAGKARDTERLRMMLDIAEAEEAWDRDVWGTR